MIWFMPSVDLMDSTHVVCMHMYVCTTYVHTIAWLVSVTTGQNHHHPSHPFGLDWSFNGRFKHGQTAQDRCICEKHNWPHAATLGDATLDIGIVVKPALLVCRAHVHSMYILCFERKPNGPLHGDMVPLRHVVMVLSESGV